MKNPFREDGVVGACRRYVRLSRSLATVAYALILFIFSIGVLYLLATFTWRYLLRTVFAGEWGVS